MRFIKCRLKPKERKLVAIIGSAGSVNCLYLPSFNSEIESILFDGVSTRRCPASLEQILKDGGRTAVYEGDTVEITF